MSEEIIIHTSETTVSGHELAVLLITGCTEDNSRLLSTRDSYIWGALVFDLIGIIKNLQEVNVAQALDHAITAYNLSQKELLAGGLDFITYLNNRHVPLKDLTIEFVDHIFKHCKDNNEAYHLSYVYNIIAFIEKAFINSNEALNNLMLKGFLEETFAPNNTVTFDLVPASYFVKTVKGEKLLEEVKGLDPASLVPEVAKLLNFEPVVKMIFREFFKAGAARV